jgi:hypothetical protein
LTLNTKGGNDFFGSADTGSMRRQSGDNASAPKPAAVATGNDAQKKFGNAKAISSKSFEGGQER